MSSPGVDASTDDEGDVKSQHPYEGIEEKDILSPDTLACPWAVMVQFINTDIAFIAVRGGVRPIDSALTALHHADRSRGSFILTLFLLDYERSVAPSFFYTPRLRENNTWVRTSGSKKNTQKKN